MIGGFSQGAAMALHIGARHPEPLAGVLALSGYLVLADRLARERAAANLSTPVLMCHGTFDDVVPIRAGRASVDALRASAPEGDVQWQEFPIGHEVSPDELALVGGWLHARLG